MNASVPDFDDLFGNVTPDGDGYFYYSYNPHVPQDAEPHDYIEPALWEARDVIKAAGYLIDEEATGCDHDSIWVRFRHSG